MINLSVDYLAVQDNLVLFEAADGQLFWSLSELKKISSITKTNSVAT